METACEKGEPMAKITKQLRKMSERLAEDMTHSKYAEAIVKGMFLAVQTRMIQDTDGKCYQLIFLFFLLASLPYEFYLLS